LRLKHRNGLNIRECGWVLYRLRRVICVVRRSGSRCVTGVVGICGRRRITGVVRVCGRRRITSVVHL